MVAGVDGAGVAEADAVVDGVGPGIDAEALLVGDVEAVDDGDGLLLGNTLAETLRLGLVLAEALGLPLTLAVTLELAVTLVDASGDRDKLALIDGEILCEMLADCPVVGDTDAVTDSVRDTDGEAATLDVADAVFVPLPVLLGDAVPLTVKDELTLAVAELDRDCEGLIVPEPETDGDTDAETVPVMLTLSEPLLVRDGLPLLEMDRELLMLVVAEAVTVRDADTDTDAVVDGDVEAVTEGVGDMQATDRTRVLSTSTSRLPTSLRSESALIMRGSCSQVSA